MLIAAIVAGWVVCGVLSWGLTLGYFTRKFPYMKHEGIAAYMCVSGPVGLLVSLTMGDRSFRWKHPTAEARRAEFMKQCGLLGESYFNDRYL